MKIAFNPSTVAALIAPPNNKDITFDLRGQNIFARGVKFCGTDTNTWRDIKINNVSIDSNILDLRDGDNTTLTNINGIVTINSTWRPVVDNLTSDSTTSSLSANLGRVLKALIDGKSNSGHTHDDRYLKLTGGTMQLGEGLKFHADNNYFDTNEDARIISLLDGNGRVCDGGLIIDERTTLDGKEYVTELLRIRDSEFKWRGNNILHSGNTYVSNNKGYINSTEITLVNNANYSGSTGKLKSLGSYTYDNLSTDIPTNAVSYKIIASGGTVLGDYQYNVLHIPWQDGNYGMYLLFGTNNGRFGIKHKHSGVVREVLDSSNYKSYAIPTSASCNKNWSYSGQSGQPTWLWGTNDGTNMYVWNPSNFRVAYASSAGNADTLDGYHASSFSLTSHTHDYIPRHGMMNSAYACIPTYNGETGWHRIATIQGSIGYGSYILYLCGNWSYSSNTNAIIHIDTMYTTAQLTQVSGIVGYIDSIRLVNIDGNAYYVDVHINYTGANTPGTVYCYFLGNGTITPRTSAEKITESVTSSAELDLVNGGRAHSASSASKLQTPRTIWGQSFDGTGNVMGNLIIENFDILGYKGARILQNLSGNLGINPLNNVGIGTTSPAYKLHVDGDIYTTTGFKKNGSSDSYVLLGGGGHQTISSLSVNYANSAGNADTVDGYHAASFLKNMGGGNWDFNFNDGFNSGIYYVHSEYIQLNAPSVYGLILDASTNAGHLQLASASYNEYYIRGCWWTSGGGTWDSWRTIIHSGNISSQSVNYANSAGYADLAGSVAWDNVTNRPTIPNPTDYYWANVKISTSSSTTTSPTVHTLTATRVCAGHNPEIDNSISCSNWFRSSGATGWYNTTYLGGWYMSDTSWIRAHNNVGIYTGGQILSSSSIKMGNILLEHTDEINNITDGSIYLNYRNSGNVILCQGGGKVGIGTTNPFYKLDVDDLIRANGFHHYYADSNDYILLAGGGYMSYKTGTTEYSTAILLGEYVWLTILMYNTITNMQVVPDNISKPTKNIYVLGGASGRGISVWRISTDGTIHMDEGTSSVTHLYATICYVAS